MSKLVLEGAQTIKNTKELLSVNVQNQSAVNDPNATKMQASVVISSSGSSVRRDIAVNSPVNPLAAKVRRDLITSASKSEVINSSLERYVSIFTGQESTEAELLSRVNELIADFSSLRGSNDTPLRITMLDRASGLTDSLNSITDQIKDLRQTAHLDMLDGIENVNSVLKGLFDLNRQLQVTTKQTSNFQLHSVRDKLLNQLSQYFDINVNIGYAGTVQIRMRGTSEELLSLQDYSRFTTSGTFIQDSGNESAPGDLTVSLQKLDSSGRVLSTRLVQDDSGNVNGFRSGKIAGHIELRDNILFNALESVRGMTKSVAKAFNDVHNEGSPWPPVTKMQGEELISAFDIPALTGEVTIGAVDSKGNQLQKSGGAFHERRIDLDNLRTNSKDGKVTVHDFVKEFNRVMDTNHLSRRAAIGEIKFQGAQGDNQIIQLSNETFLVNNIQLAATSEISNGSFTFDFEVEGNSYYGSDVTITDVAVGGTSVNGFQQQNFRLEKDFAGRLGVPIAVPVGAVNNNNVVVSFKIVGDNGEIRTGTARYIVDGTEQAILNKRYELDGANASTTGEFGDPSGNGTGIVPNQTGVATARFVDENGFDIADTDIATKGRLIIESNAPDYRFALKSSSPNKQSNLMVTMGLNNFFTVNGDTISVREDIAKNPDLVAGGQIARNAGKVVTSRSAGNKATAVMQFNANGAGDFNVGDFVTVDNTTFTIRGNGHPNPTADDVVLGPVPNFNDTLGLIVNAINNHPEISAKFQAQLHGTTITVEAKTGGEWANTKVVVVNLHASTVSINGALAGSSDAGRTQNGTDIDVQTTIFEYNIGVDSKQNYLSFSELSTTVLSFEAAGSLPAGIGSIKERLSDILSVLQSQQTEAKNENELRQTMLDRNDQDFRKKYGVDEDSLLLEAAEIASILRAQSLFFASIIKLISETQQTIAAA